MAKSNQDTQYVSGEEHHSRQMILSDSSNKLTIPGRTVGLVVAAVVLCGLSFAGGVAYQKGHTKAITASNSNFPGSPGSGFARRGGAVGQVTAVSSGSITINNQRTGTSSTYNITSNTSISNSGQTASVSDIQTGDTVLIMTSSSDTTTATRILINPSFGGGSGGPGAGTAPGQLQ